MVIFDCDGVLVDSEIIYHRIGAREMTRLGFPLTVERSIELFSGLADEKILQVFEAEYGRTFSEHHLKQTLKITRDSFCVDLKPVSNISKVIDYLEEKNIGKCIASNGFFEHIITSLHITKLNKYFSNKHIFDISKVKQGKPMPDLFLYAAEKMQTKVDYCVVIEDSVVGVTAAKAAKIPVIGFLGGAHAKSSFYRKSILDVKPDIIANDTDELLAILKG